MEENLINHNCSEEKNKRKKLIWKWSIKMSEFEDWKVLGNSSKKTKQNY